MTEKSEINTLIYPGFVTDAWSSIEERYLWLDQPMSKLGMCYWLVPPTGSRYASVRDPINRSKEPVYVSKLKSGDARVIEFDVHKYNVIKNFFKLAWIFKNYKIDLVYTHFGLLRFHVELAAKLLGVKVVKGEHNFAFHEDRRFKTIKRIFWKTVTHYFIPVSRAVEKHLQINGVMRDNGTVVYDGFDLSRYPISNPEIRRAEIQEQLGVNQDSRFLVCVAKIAPAKQQLLLVEMMARIQDKNVMLLLVGDIYDQPYFDKMMDLIRQEGLEGRVHFLGYRQDIPELMDAADISFLPSLVEGLGNVVIESYLMGTPVIASDLPAIREVIENDETGYLVRHDDIDEYVNLTIQLLGDGELRSSMGAKGMERVRETFNRDKFITDTVAALQQAVNY